MEDRCSESEHVEENSPGSTGRDFELERTRYCLEHNSLTVKYL